MTVEPRAGGSGSVLAYKLEDVVAKAIDLRWTQSGDEKQFGSCRRLCLGDREDRLALEHHVRLPLQLARHSLSVALELGGE